MHILIAFTPRHSFSSPLTWANICWQKGLTVDAVKYTHAPPPPYMCIREHLACVSCRMVLTIFAPRTNLRYRQVCSPI